MAKRASQSPVADSNKPVPPASERSDVKASGAQLLVTRVGDEALGFRLAAVSEIIRVPRLAHMPFAPESLLGLANLRGLVLPVVSLRRLLGFPDIALDAAARIVVMGGSPPVGFAVDTVETLVELPSVRIVADSAGAGRLDPGVLDGVVKGSEGEPTIKIVNPRQVLLRGRFDRMGVTAPARAVTATAAPMAKPKTAEPASSSGTVANVHGS